MSETKKIKSFSKGLQSVNDALRQITFVASSETVDRYGDTMRIAGIDTTNYEKNPVVLAFHDSGSLPVGKAVAIQKTANPPQLLITVQFATADENPEADKVYRCYKSGILSAVSIGFMPGETELRTDENGRVCGMDFLTSELLELSCVPVPANPEALAKSAPDAKSETDAAVESFLLRLVEDSEEEQLAKFIQQLTDAA